MDQTPAPASPLAVTAAPVVIMDCSSLPDLTKVIAAESGIAAREDVVAEFFRLGAPVVPSHTNVDHYWQKRRLQNNLRRVLELVQEHFGFEGESRDEIRAAFDSLNDHHPDPCEGPHAWSQSHFCTVFDSASLWPWDMSVRDRCEVFSSLRVPSLSASRTVLGGRSMLPLDRETFGDGFNKVPFNLPDFPVPTHLMPASMVRRREAFTAQEIQELAEVVILTFCMQKTGLGKIKDVFQCGLLSLEEIQMTLPRLTPLSLVRDAVELIIRMAAPLLAQDEWRTLVVEARNSQDLAVKVPKGWARESMSTTVEGDLLSRSSVDCSSIENSTCKTFGEDEVFQEAVRLIDWKTAQCDIPASSSADQSVDSLRSRAERDTPTVKLDVGRRLASVDVVAWINLNLHADHGGPVLANAFARCCELCTKRRSALA